MSIYFCIFGLLLSAQFLSAMEKNEQQTQELQTLQAPRTYQGTKISLKNLVHLGTPLPPEKSSIVQTWKEENQWLLLQLMRLRYPHMQWKQDHDQARQSLHEHGIRNLGRNNYVFELPGDPDLIVQIGGKIHRHHQICVAHGIKPAQSCILPTQLTQLTLSRHAYNVVVQDVLQEVGDYYLFVPKTYVVPVHPISPSDDAAFVVQERYANNPQKIDRNKGLMVGIPDRAITVLAHVIHRAGLWNIQTQLMLNDKNQFVLSNLQQENSARPQDFFHKSNKEYEMNITEGFKELFYLCAHNEQRRCVQQYAQERVIPFMQYEKKHLTHCLDISPEEVN